MNHELLKDIIIKIDDGAYWKLLQDKQALRAMTNLTNVRQAKTFLIPDKDTIKKMSSLDKGEIVIMANRLVIHRYLESLSDIASEENVGGSKRINTTYNSSDNTVSIAKSKAIIKDIGIDPKPTSPYVRFFGISGLIEDEALIDVEFIKIQAGGAITLDSLSEENRKKETRMLLIKGILKTVSSDGYNYSYLFEKASYMFAVLSTYLFKISMSLILICPATMIACLTTQNLVPESLVRAYYASCRLHNSMVPSPWYNFYRMFNGNNLTAMGEIDRFNKIRMLKEKMPKKEKYTYKDLLDVVLNIFPDEGDAKKLIIIHYLMYLEYETIISGNDNITSSFAFNITHDIFQKSAAYFNPESPRGMNIKDHTFSREFIMSPFFMYSATNIKKLNSSDQYTLAYKTVVETMKTFHERCMGSVGSYMLRKDMVENLRQQSRIINMANLEDKPTASPLRSKFYICKDEAAIFVDALIYPKK